MGLGGSKDSEDDLIADIRKDITARSDWMDRVEKLGRKRLGERKRNMLYPNAPNIVEPIIDDNIRAKVAQEMSVMFGPRQIANFIPLSAEASELQRHAEVGFDAMLRLMLNFRSKMEHALDTKMERGFAILKQVENRKAYVAVMGKQRQQQQILDPMGQVVVVTVEMPDPVVPDCEVVDPFDLVVPISTQRLEDAERITQIHRYSIRQFKDLADERGWTGYEKAIELAEDSYSEQDSRKAVSNRAGFKAHIGLEEINDNIDRIEVWEVYHYKEGKRYRSMLIPLLGKDGEMECLPWVWLDDETERPFPYTQLRAENRRREFYDTRGDAELLLDNQNIANSYMNAKGVQLDFFAKPVFTGPRGTDGNVRWMPGEVLPDGVAVAQMPKIDSIFDFSADQERAKAARRSGSAQGSYGDTRMSGDKTATQVNAEAISNQRLTNVSVLRDGEPMSAFYQLMWDYMRHNPVALPMVNESRQFQGAISMQVFSVPFRVESAASAQHANPDFVLQQLMTLGQLLTNNPYIRQEEFAKILVDQINPQLTNQLVYDPKTQGPGGMPLEQQFAQVQQQVQAQGQYLQEIAKAEMGEGDEMTTQPGATP